MKTVNELILEKLREEIERNGYNSDQQMLDDNVWVMAAAVIPFEESPETAEFLPYSLNDTAIRESYFDSGKPTHIVRVVLRTNDSYGLSEYVDGTDVHSCGWYCCSWFNSYSWCICCNVSWFCCGSCWII